jgi:uncharacterized membrane protein
VLLLRFAHVFFGAIWVGMMTYQVFFLMPAVAESGPEGGKLMGALLRRRVPVVIPIIALIAIISGFWLFMRLSAGDPGALMGSPMGRGFAWGGAASVVAFLVGIIIVRPAMMRTAQLGASLATATPDERAARTAEMQRLRARGARASWVVMALLLFALAAMAVARYL